MIHASLPGFADHARQQGLDELTHQGTRLHRNAFQETLLGLEYSDRCGVDAFSSACVSAYLGADWCQFGYRFTQVFEPGVLREVALLEGVPYDSVSSLSYRPTARIRRLADQAARASELSVVEGANLASALISIARFDEAKRLVGELSVRARRPRDRFELGWLEFMISNRCDDGAASPQAFERMRAAITSGEVPGGRVLDACAQAIVWYLKRREVTEHLFKWAVEAGRSILESRIALDPATVSSWYRGLAMMPAALRRSHETREYMRLARGAAERAIARNSGAYELNTLKTYYESAVKEHIYVTCDFAAAEAAGHALIALDDAWSPSHGELGDVYSVFGQVARAADLYERAASLGPPYVGHHLLRAAECREELKHHDRALEHYLTLSNIAPASEGLRRRVHAAARRVSGPSPPGIGEGA